MMLPNSGYILCIGSAVPLQATRKCAVVSLGAEHRGQEGSNQGLSMAHRQLLENSLVSSFKLCLNFLTSCQMFIKAGWRQPDRLTAVHQDFSSLSLKMISWLLFIIYCNCCFYQTLPLIFGIWVGFFKQTPEITSTTITIKTKVTTTTSAKIY